MVTNAITSLGLIVAVAIGISVPTSHSFAEELPSLSVAFTFGFNGAPCSNRFLAGETINLTAIASGISVPDRGSREMTVRFLVVDKDGRVHFSRGDDNVVAEVEPKSDAAKFCLYCILSPEIQAGTYDFVVEVQDKNTQRLYRSSRPITVLPKDQFRISQFYFSANKKKTARLGTTFETCQPVYLNWVIQNPKSEDGIWKLDVKIDVLDKEGRSINASPISSISSSRAPSSGVAHTQSVFVFPNSGSYTIQIEVKDLLSGKVESASIPVRALSPLGNHPVR